MTETKALPPEKASWFTLTHCQNGLIIASVAQLVLGVLLYFLAAIDIVPLIIEASLALVLALFAQFLGDAGRKWRVIIRILFIAYLVFTIAVGAFLIIASLMQSENNAETNAVIRAGIWLTIALVILPPLLIFQPALAILAKYRRRFDLVLIRVTAIIVLVLTLLVCVFALEYRLYDDKLIVTSLAYTPVLFGQELDLSIAIDNILTRVLFSLCSAAFVVFSFKLHPEDSATH